MRTQDKNKLKRLNTPHLEQMRNEIEQELSAIETLTSAHHHLQTTDGFVDYYLRMSDLYLRRTDAYERLEQEYERIFGARRYSEWNSFKNILIRHIAKCRSRRK